MTTYPQPNIHHGFRCNYTPLCELTRPDQHLLCFSVHWNISGINSTNMQSMDSSLNSVFCQKVSVDLVYDPVMNLDCVNLNCRHQLAEWSCLAQLVINISNNPSHSFLTLHYRRINPGLYNRFNFINRDYPISWCSQYKFTQSRFMTGSQTRSCDTFRQKTEFKEESSVNINWLGSRG